jgi:hypothetical protein
MAEVSLDSEIDPERRAAGLMDSSSMSRWRFRAAIGLAAKMTGDGCDRAVIRITHGHAGGAIVQPTAMLLLLQQTR